VAALQDPRKEVMSIRNLFPDRIAMRLDEPGAGVGFVRLESDPDPVRVRAAWVSDEDIRAMASQCTATLAPDRELRAIEGEAA
jgi:DNA segregation ATPase FtsK/SpoIIIE, S-DNA-T family